MSRLTRPLICPQRSTDRYASISILPLAKPAQETIIHPSPLKTIGPRQHCPAVDATEFRNNHDCALNGAQGSLRHVRPQGSPERRLAASSELIYENCTVCRLKRPPNAYDSGDGQTFQTFSLLMLSSSKHSWRLLPRTCGTRWLWRGSVPVKDWAPALVVATQLDKAPPLLAWSQSAIGNAFRLFPACDWLE